MSQTIPLPAGRRHTRHPSDETAQTLTRTRDRSGPSR